MSTKTSTQHAEELVTGDRQRAYGHPYDDFSRTAGAASAMGFRFQDAAGNVRELTARDVPIFMILVKLSREVHQHQVDNVTDGIGYFRTLEMVVDREAELAK